MYLITKRLFDFILSIILSVILAVPFLLIAVMVKVSSKGTVLYWSDRIGKDGRIFKMPKFRTMKMTTPEVATHLLQNPEGYVTRVGKVLRKLSLDELPQLYSVFKGDLSFVGPRPALFNQADLILLRSQKGIDRVRPGITGWAQINGRDNLTIAEKVDYDAYYLEHASFLLDIKVLWITLLKTVSCEGVTH